jgi:hypothetical protein
LNNNQTCLKGGPRTGKINADPKKRNSTRTDRLGRLESIIQKPKELTLRKSNNDKLPVNAWDVLGPRIEREAIGSMIA